MITLKNLFSRALLALMLASGAGAALAGPTYHVTVDTRGYDGSGNLDFLLLGYEGVPGAHAFLSNFTGDYGDTAGLDGDASGDLATGVVLGTDEGFGAFMQSVDLGGRFGFDLRFDVEPMGEGASLSLGLFSDALGRYLGVTGNLVEFYLTPGLPDTIVADASLANVSEVPEPATAASLAFGLMLMGWTLRLRRQG
jgi:hypothetical protein